MRLGIMLRHIDQNDGGVKVYSRELVRSLVKQNTKHDIFLLYRNRARMGSFGVTTGTQEVLLEGGSILQWDQMKVPLAVRKLDLDVVFNPKYSIPLVTRAKTAWICHGLDWYVMPRASPWKDRLSHRFLVPQYASRCDALFAVSEITREHIQQYLRVDPARVHVARSGLSAAYRNFATPQQLAAIRSRYGLPDRYLLYCGAIYPPKNFTRLIQAFARVGPRLGVPLVIAGGSNRYLSAKELLEPKRLGIEQWVRWLGWLDNDELPGLYRQAEALLLPSLFESVGLPVIEAMASGCPVLTSDRFGTREIAQGAALLVDPESTDEVAGGIERLLTNPQLRAELIAAGSERANQFTWDKTASVVMKVLEQL